MQRNLALLILMWVVSASGQRRALPGEEEYRHILDGMQASLRTTVVLDHKEYLPGERICATVTVENATSSAVRAFPPFRSKDTMLSLSMRTQEGDWTPLSDRTPNVVAQATDMMAGRKVETIAAAEKRSENVCFTEDDWVGDPIRHTPIWILRPGQYKVRFESGQSAETEFTVLPIDDVSAVVALPLPEADLYRKDASRLRPGCGGIVAAAFRSGERTILVRSTSGIRDTCRKLAGQDDLLRAMHPAIRIAETRDQLKSMELTALGDGSVEVTWEDGHGRRHREAVPRPKFPDQRER